MQDANRSVDRIWAGGLAYVPAAQSRIQLRMKISSLQNPSPPFETHAQVCVGVNCAGKHCGSSDLDLQLEHRFRRRVQETAVSIDEYLQELRAGGAHRNQIGR